MLYWGRLLYCCDDVIVLDWGSMADCNNHGSLRSTGESWDESWDETRELMYSHTHTLLSAILSLSLRVEWGGE